MAEEPEVDPVDDDLDDEGIGAEDDEFAVDLASPYEMKTERLKAYTEFVCRMGAKAGMTVPLDGGKEIDLDPDVESARNLALIAVFADIRRIAGDGRPVFDPEDIAR